MYRSNHFGDRDLADGVVPNAATSTARAGRGEADVQEYGGEYC